MTDDHKGPPRSFHSHLLPGWCWMVSSEYTGGEISHMLLPSVSRRGATCQQWSCEPGACPCHHGANKGRTTDNKPHGKCGEHCLLQESTDPSRQHSTGRPSSQPHAGPQLRNGQPCRALGHSNGRVSGEGSVLMVTCLQEAGRPASYNWACPLALGITTRGQPST